MIVISEIDKTHAKESLTKMTLNPTTQDNSTKMVNPEWHDEVIQRLEAHEQGRSVTYSRTDANAILQEHLNTLRG